MSSPTKQNPNFNLQTIRRRSLRKTATVLSIILEAMFIVTLLTATSILQEVSSQSGKVALSLEAYQYWIMVVAIFVLGACVVNPLVISTAERSREVGIMKSLGATNTTIIKMFLIDSASIGLIGGTLGAFIGWLITVAIYGLQLGFATILMVPLRIHLFNLAVTITASLLLSITAVAYPAYRIAKLRPVNALKRET